MTLVQQPGRSISAPRSLAPKAGRAWQRACVLALALTAAIGGHALAQDAETSSVVLGPNTHADGSAAIAIGDGANASANNAVAIGVRARASGDMSVAMGLTANAEGDQAVALGSFAGALADHSTALGHNAQASATNSVAIGYQSVADRANTVSVGKAGAERQIAHVAAGTADTDAVNMAQLRATGLFDQRGNALDAVVYDAGSRQGQLTFGGHHGTRLSNVMDGLIAPGSRDAVNGSQLWAVQNQLDTIGDRVTRLEAGAPATKPAIGGNPATSLPKTTDENGAAKDVEGVSAPDRNAAAPESDQDSGYQVPVSPGASSESASASAPLHDTATVRQAQVREAVGDVKSWANEKFDGLSRKIDANQRQANRGIAASAALIDNMPYLPGKTTLNTGFATYRGQSAFGLGVSRWSENGRVNINAGISAAAGDRPIFRMGVGIVLGD